MSRSIAVGLAILTFVSCASNSSKAIAKDCRPITQERFASALFENDVLLPVQANGKTAIFVFDTGLTDTSILTEGKDTLGTPAADLPPGGNPNWRYVFLEHLRATGVIWAKRAVPLLDWDHPKESAARKIESGVIGSDMILGRDVDLNLPGNEITFYKPSQHGCKLRPPWNTSYISVPMRLTQGHSPIIDILVNGVLSPFIVDTGASSIVLNAALGAEAQLEPNGRNCGKHLSSQAATIEIADLTERQVAICLRNPEKEKDGHNLLGMPFLLKHRLWLSFSSQTVFIAKP